MPWTFGPRKSAFKINLRDRTLTCPAGHTEPFQLGSVVQFDPEGCGRCPLRSQGTTAAPARGRTVTIAPNEPLHHRLRKLVATRKGRERLRKRVKVEHRLAHLGRRQGRRARYKGVRKNLFDLRRTAAVLNVQTIQRRSEEQELRKAA